VYRPDAGAMFAWTMTGSTCLLGQARGKDGPFVLRIEMRRAESGPREVVRA
jgi:hypothetical protein